MPTAAARRPRVLYVVYWGAAEFLGQSLVVPAVKRLAQAGARVTLVTFEKPADLARTDDIDRIRRELSQEGIAWVPLQYHKRPKIPATAFDVLQGITRGLLADWPMSYDIVHARTYIGGLIGWLLAPLLGAKWIFHNEGFYPDEQVDGGVWRFGSAPHRVARYLEDRMYASADGIIALSHRACAGIEGKDAVRRHGTPVIFVPSCVDLDAFRWTPRAAGPHNGALRFIYIGSIGQRYIFHRVSEFLAEAGRELGPVHVRVLTRTEPEQVAATLRASGMPEGSWSIGSVPHAAIPGELAEHDVGLFFLTQGISEHGCSPTKVGEYWACGLPVVTTPNVSDTDTLIERHRIGVIVREHTPTEYRRAARELQTLLADPDLPRRCRMAAEAHYTLAAASDRQIELYHRLVADAAGRPTNRV